MFGEGLIILLLSFLPALLYCLVIYFTVPYKKIKLKTAFIYLFVGFMSVGFLKYFWMIFPAWGTLAETLVGGDPANNALSYYHYYYFIQVGFAEEFSKLMIFFMIEKYRRIMGDVKDHPLATMFYMGMVALGFAVIENITYGLASMDPASTLFLRSYTSVIGHMVFGLFMGYWISIGKIGARLYDRSLFDIVINKRKRLRNILYTIIGLLSATILHGIYNLHVTFEGISGLTEIYMLLIGSLIGVYWCFKNLIKKYNEKVKQIKA